MHCCQERQRARSSGRWGEVAAVLLALRQPPPEEHRAAMRLEGWERARCLSPILRDAALWAAPQDEVLARAPAMSFCALWCAETQVGREQGYLMILDFY